MTLEHAWKNFSRFLHVGKSVKHNFLPANHSLACPSPIFSRTFSTFVYFTADALDSNAALVFWRSHTVSCRIFCRSSARPASSISTWTVRSSSISWAFRSTNFSAVASASRCTACRSLARTFRSSTYTFFVTGRAEHGLDRLLLRFEHLLRHILKVPSLRAE